MEAAISDIKDEEEWSEETNQHISDDELQEAERAMNIGQRKIVIHVTRNIQEQMNGSNNELKLFIIGNTEPKRHFFSICWKIE